MISINITYEKEEWLCDISIDPEEEIDDATALKILNSCSVSQECMMETAEVLSEFVEPDQIRTFLAVLMFNHKQLSTKSNDQTVVPTIFSTHDHIRRND
jgi:hypothetical protein